MIIAGSSGTAAPIPFSLVITTSGLGLTSKVWNNIGGGLTDELMVRLPNGVYAPAVIAQIFELGGGNYEYRLTALQSASPGKVYYYVNVAGCDGGILVSRYEDLITGFTFTDVPGSVPGAGGSGSGYLVSDLIEEARALISDDHDEQPDANTGWIKPARWFRWLNWEMQALSRRCAGMGLVRGAVTEAEFTGSTTITGVMKIVGVVDEQGNELVPAQFMDGANPYFHSLTDAATMWKAEGAGDNWLVTLNGTGTARVRYHKHPAYVSAVDQYVLVPQGFEKRLVYGMVSHALIKESAASAALERKIIAADAEIGLALFGQGVSAKVRPVRRTPIYPGRGRYR